MALPDYIASMEPSSAEDGDLVRNGEAVPMDDASMEPSSAEDGDTQRDTHFGIFTRGFNGAVLS